MKDERLKKKTSALKINSQRLELNQAHSEVKGILLNAWSELEIKANI